MSGMDFFGHQERAQAATRRLVVLFGAAVAGIVVCIYFAAWAAFSIADGRGPHLWQPELLAWATFGTLGVVGLAALFKTSQLRSGGGKVAQLLGGREVPPETQDPQERMLRNVVEEMSIAAGVPVPAIYVLDGETGINAFAAGWSPTDAAVAVTRGCLETLNRDELQGVIAHEFSHVFHGDMRLNIRLMGVLFGIVCIATIGRILFRVLGRGGGSDGKGKGGVAAVALFGLFLVLIGWIGVLFARLIQAAVSRQREFLADASAVAYTRNPFGIGMALAKIGGLGGRLQSPHAEEASHMLFADGMRRFFGGAFATHPAVETRVERILPGFRAQLAKGRSLEDAVAATPPPAGAAGLTGGAAPAPAPKLPAAAVVRSAGAPGPEHVDAAKELLRGLPLDVVSAAREAARAPALVVALLLDRSPARRQEQLAPLAQRDAALAQEARSLFQALAQAPPRAALPLLSLAVPALRTLPAAARARLHADARALALADGTLSPFEFALVKTLERHAPADDGPPRRPVRRAALQERADATLAVLAALARVGAAGDEAAARSAFGRGVDALATFGEPALPPAGRDPVQDLERAVVALDDVSPLGQRNLLEACAATAGADGRLSADEAELLRALAGLWDCPLPIVVAPSGQALGGVRE